MLLSLFQRLLLRLEPETAHRVALMSLAAAYQIGLTRHWPKPDKKPCQVMGLPFPNPLGLAAGLDKNGDYIDALASLGFGFIEIGTVTPKPQTGNPKPRLFRLPQQLAIINRLGFNNKGADYVANRLRQMHYRGILGINIGKNRDTPNTRAVQDYLYCLHKLWPYASYITINISSPNTEGLRNLHQPANLTALLSALKKEQCCIAEQQQKYIPLVVKISPDLTDTEITQVAEILLQQQIDGVIATNTTIIRPNLMSDTHHQEMGGLSGKPLFLPSTRVLQTLQGLLKDNIPIIASGGIMDSSSMQEKMNAGAKLCQIYTAFIYFGPPIIKQLICDCS